MNAGNGSGGGENSHDNRRGFADQYPPWFAAGEDYAKYVIREM
jgi:hypothetical protein